ncbi:hypothetical protein IJ732_07610 [bacterium]|nr:hypothetical protein [bacterium]
MKISDVIKILIKGFWENGLISLLKVVFAHWIITFIIIGIISFLCSNPDTSVAAWIIIGIFAIFTAIKALFEIIIEIKNYINTTDPEDKKNILKSIGGKIFDFSICLIGVLQVLKIFSHISRITKASSSVISFVDDTASAVSKLLKDITK